MEESKQDMLRVGKGNGGPVARRHMTKEAALKILEENKRWPKGTIAQIYLDQALETIRWYNELESETNRCKFD